MDKYIKIALPKMPASKESLFVQGDVNDESGGRGGLKKRGGDDKNYENNY